MTDPFVPMLTAPERGAAPVIWLAFRSAEILVLEGAGAPALPCCVDLAEHGLAPLRSQFLGLYGAAHCYAAEIAATQALPANWRALGLRDLFGLVEPGLVSVATRAFQLIDWERNHQHCSRCGSAMTRHSGERARRCPRCAFTTYPPVSPATMVLITRGRELLLARKAAWPEGRYSALAGFVEPGETLEDTVRRETLEEVGVEVKNIRYFGSQPWPFPHSLMVAFTAEHAGGEIRPDGVEIADARWFACDQLPRLPASISISRRLIDTIAASLRRSGSVGRDD